MQSELIPLLEKIRAANCLTETEMHALSVATSELSARRELDALDSQWEKTSANTFTATPKVESSPSLRGVKAS